MAQQAITPPVRSSGFFALMRNRNYALLWTSQGISLLGDRFHWIAISLWVYALTGSALSVSYAIIALMIGPAAVGLFAGVLVDRWNRKWTMILADIARGILVALIPWLMSHDIRLVYVDLFLVSCATAFFRPAMLATLPQTVAKADLLPANSFFTAVDTATEVVGPVLAGLLVQAAGYSAAMYVDAASYVASASIVVFLSVPQRVTREVGERATRIVADIREGFRYIRRDRIQFGLFIFILLGWWVSGLNSLQTPLAKGVLGLTDRQFGWFNGIWGGGFIVASLLLGWYGIRFPKGRLIAAGFIGWAVATGSTGVSANAGMLYASVFWVGVANIVLFISLSTTIMEVTPQGMLGRVLTTRQVALAVVRVLSMLVFGELADLIGVRIAVLGMSGLSLIGIALGLIAFPEILRLGGTTEKTAAVIPSLGGVLRGVYRQLVATLIGAMDTVYRIEPQRMLNAAVLLIVGTAWLALVLTQLDLALFTVAVVTAAAIARVLHMKRVEYVGSKNVRQQAATTVRREFEKGRRSPVTTGPTAKQ